MNTETIAALIAILREALKGVVPDWLNPYVAQIPDVALLVASPVLAVLFLGLAINWVSTTLKKALNWPPGPEVVTVTDASVNAIVEGVMAAMKQRQLGQVSPEQFNQSSAQLVTKVQAAANDLAKEETSESREAIQALSTGRVAEGISILTNEAEERSALAESKAKKGSTPSVVDPVALEQETRAIAKKWRRLAAFNLALDQAQALRAYQRSLQFDPDSIGAQMEVARLLANGGRNGEAEAAYKAITERYGALRPDIAAEGWSALGALYARDGRFSEAKVAHQCAEKIRQSTDDIAGRAYNLSALGDIELRDGRLTEARKYHIAALKIGVGRPKEYAAYNHRRLGEVSQQLGELARSKQEFKRALDMGLSAVKPTRLMVLEGLGMSHAFMGEFEAARHKLEEGLRLSKEPRNKIRFLTGLGRLEIERQRYDQARLYLKKAVHVAEKSESPHHFFQDDQIAYLDSAAGDVKNAQVVHVKNATHYKQRNEMDKFAECQLNLARANARLHRAADARLCLEAARQHFKAREKYLDLAGCKIVEAEILAEEGNIAAAAEIARKAADDYARMGAARRAHCAEKLLKGIAATTQSRARPARKGTAVA